MTVTMKDDEQMWKKTSKWSKYLIWIAFLLLQCL